MKIKIWKSECFGGSRWKGYWVVAYPLDGEVEFARCRTWELAMAQASWLMQRYPQPERLRPKFCCGEREKYVPSGPHHACWCPRYVPREEWRLIAKSA